MYRIYIRNVPEPPRRFLLRAEQLRTSGLFVNNLTPISPFFDVKPIIISASSGFRRVGGSFTPARAAFWEIPHILQDVTKEWRCSPSRRNSSSPPPFTSRSRVTLLPDLTFVERDKPPPLFHSILFSFVCVFRPLRNASPENYVSSCGCCDGGADDDDGAPDAASEHRSPAGSDGPLGGRGCP